MKNFKLIFMQFALVSLSLSFPFSSHSQVLATTGEFDQLETVRTHNDLRPHSDDSQYIQTDYKFEVFIDPRTGEKYISLTTKSGQTWFTENLRNEIYSNGDSIEYIHDIDDWSSAVIGAWGEACISVKRKGISL